MSDRVLTPRALNRAVLSRQLLLARAPMDPMKAAERIGGLQTQYAPSPYVGLWTRLEGFVREDLTRALERRRVIQGTLLRATIHMVPRADYWPWALAVRHERRNRWLRATRHAQDAATIERLAARVRRVLAAEGPRTRADLVARLGIDAGTWNGVGLWLDLVRVPPSGTWERRRADLYGLAEDWVGPVGDVTGTDGVGLLVRRYLRAFGPASRRDIADWAGLPAATVGRALESMRLRRFRDERGAELLDLAGAPLPDPETPAPVRFLPTWDAALLVHARRAQIVPERHRPLIFNTKTPQSVAVFLVDGQVAGTWRVDDGRVRTSAFDPLPRAVRRELDDEAERLGVFHS